MNQSIQSESTLETELITQLVVMGYEPVKIPNDAAMVANLQVQLNKHNAEFLMGVPIVAGEMQQILNHLKTGSIYEKAYRLRDRYPLKREHDGSTVHIRFLNSEHWCKNEYQVTQQVTINGAYKNRYDVTLLINGLPLVQIELKRRGVELKKAFHQINRYQHDSYDGDSGLFQYVQLFVISNGVNTRYFANGDGKSDANRSLDYNFTFNWTDKENKAYNQLNAFAEHFLKVCHVSKMMTHYMVLATDKVMRVLRPYQFYAVEAIINHVKQSDKSGYIWHTTGSGKTLTSFKASQVIKEEMAAEVQKILFVVDRKDLDDQTVKEFNAFEDGCVDETPNTASLVKKLKSPLEDDKLIVTTLQKLSRAISHEGFKEQIEHLREQKVLFIFDECHRSQFGETHSRIKKFFNNAQMFGFTGTPIFVDNQHKVGKHARTTVDLFDECLHKYTIVDAIHDHNVLPFMVEYIETHSREDIEKIAAARNIPISEIDEKEINESPERLAKVVDYILEHHPKKTFKDQSAKNFFTGMFTVGNVATLIKYYEIFQEKQKNKEHPLKIATIFSYDDNSARLASDADDLGGIDDAEEVESISPSNKVALERFIQDYNQTFGTKYSTNSDAFNNYYKDVSKRVKNQEIDILLVVNMFLTGFDSPPLNTLYVDKNLKHHGLIQAFSRTNRLYGERKRHGNIVCFRDLKGATDKAIELFSNKDARETVLVKPYEHFVEEYNKAVETMLKIAPTIDAVDELMSEDEQLIFVQAFRALMRLQAILVTFSDHDPSKLSLSAQGFADYKSKYLDIRDHVIHREASEKESILDEIDFETELIHSDLINVSYILNLIAGMADLNAKEQQKRREHIYKMLETTPQLRAKEQLFKEFMLDHDLELARGLTDVDTAFNQFWKSKCEQAAIELCKEEKLKLEEPKGLRKVISNYQYFNRMPTSEEISDLLNYDVDIFDLRETQDRITRKIEQFIETFYENMG